jgi:hypothetical protein
VNVREGLITIVWILAAIASVAAQDQSQANKSTNSVAVNQDSLTIQDFSKRVDEYVKLRKRAQAGLPALKPGKTATEVSEYQRSLAKNVQAQAGHPKAGEVFTPAISDLFRKLIATPLDSKSGGKIRASLHHAEPVRKLGLQVNEQYPQVSAVQSTPPTLLSNLPKLPSEIEYRIVGRELVLLDTASNLIIDLLPDALPARQDSARRNND